MGSYNKEGVAESLSVQEVLTQASLKVIVLQTAASAPGQA